MLGLNCKDDVLSPDGHGWEACDMSSKIKMSCCAFYQLISPSKSQKVLSTVSLENGTSSNVFCIIKRANYLEYKISMASLKT